MNTSEVALTKQVELSSAVAGIEGTSLIRGPIRTIPFRLSVSIPLLGWRLGSLCGLKAGQLLLTGISAAEDVPVRVGGALLGCAELDNVDGQMAVRLTKLS